CRRLDRTRWRGAATSPGQCLLSAALCCYFFFQAEDGIRDFHVTGVQTCALPISPEVFNNASFMVMFPLTFLANTFVPIENLPTVLKVFAEWNPVSAVVAATRELFGNTGGMPPTSQAWSMQHPVATTLIWVVVIMAIFVPLALRQYKRTVSR